MDLGLAGRRALVTGAGKGEAAGEECWWGSAGFEKGVPALILARLRHRAQHSASVAGGWCTRCGREPDTDGP